MPDTTHSKQIEQGRAKTAYALVKKIKDEYPKKEWDEYTSGVKKLPVYIKTNGLGQSLAFIKNRSNFPHIYQQLAEWLQQKDEKRLVPEGDLVQQVIEMESPQYRQVTIETLALLNWMRRFVDGFKDN